MRLGGRNREQHIGELVWERHGWACGNPTRSQPVVAADIALGVADVADVVDAVIADAAVVVDAVVVVVGAGAGVVAVVDVGVDGKRHLPVLSSVHPQALGWVSPLRFASAGGSACGCAHMCAGAARFFLMNVLTRTEKLKQKVFFFLSRAVRRQLGQRMNEHMAPQILSHLILRLPECEQSSVAY